MQQTKCRLRAGCMGIPLGLIAPLDRKRDKKSCNFSQMRRMTGFDVVFRLLRQSKIVPEGLRPAAHQGSIMSDAAENTGTTSEIDAQSKLTGVLDFMRGICGNLLADFPDVHRWDQTDEKSFN